MNIVTLLAHSAHSELNPPMYNTVSPSTTDTGANILALLFIFLILVAVYVLNAFFLSRLFKKAGVEEWKAWVPVYNNWTQLELGGQKGYWAVLAFVPLVNFVSVVFMILAMYHIGLKFGKSEAFVLLAVFFPLIWLVWLAMGSAQWEGSKPKASKAKASKKAA